MPSGEFSNDSQKRRSRYLPATPLVMVLRPPREAVVILPFPLECLAVACPCPELGLLQEYGINAGIYDWTNVPFLEICEVVVCRNNVGDEVSVPDSVALHSLLSFVQMPLAIPLASEIVLLLSPCNARHEETEQQI